jgi:hypothetical protein
MCKSLDDERFQDAGGVFHTGGKEKRGQGRKKGYIYSRFCDFLVQLVLLIKEPKTAQPSSSTTPRHLMNEKPQNET